MGIAITIGVLLLVGIASPLIARADVPYTVTIDLKGKGRLKDALRDVSDLVRLEDRPPASEALLQQRITEDEGRFQQILRANGFYGASIHVERSTAGDKAAVLFTVTPGKQYTLSSVDIQVEDNAPLVTPGLKKKTGLRVGDGAVSKAILDGEKSILAALQEEGYVWAGSKDRKITVDHATALVAVEYILIAGPAARFGPVVVNGPESLDPAVVLREIPWKEGDLLRKSALEKARAQLTRRGLFSLVQVEPDPSARNQAVVPVVITVTDRKHRTIALGLHYRSDEGPGAEVLWENRNMFDKGHRLTLQSQVSSIEQNASAQYELPGFMREDQTLTLHFKMANESPDAYESESLDTGIWLERRLSSQLTLGAGPDLRLSHVTERFTEDTYFLLGLPVELNWDTRDDRLNPVAGGMLKIHSAPYVDLNNADTTFFKNEINYSVYHDFSDDKDLVLAARLRVGMTQGESLEDVPADIRFYAGGGGSIRGYGYQMAGPLDRKDEPIGGRSVLEGAIELRKHLKGNLGLAFFVDGGTVYSAPAPDFSAAMRWGAGVGVRYFTPIGPIRFDVAAPLNPRDVDSSVQFYISLGQAF